MNYPKINLKPGKEASIRRFHPWVFSGALEADPGLGDGTVVEVYTHKREYLATGHFHNESIAVKILTFTQQAIGGKFWEGKIRDAWALRMQCGFGEMPGMNSFRIVNAEGDGLPGLITDFYNGTAVIQGQTTGMQNSAGDVAIALKEVLGDKLVAVYDKSSSEGNYLVGSKGDDVIRENGHRFKVDWETGQKTGFYLDQRENRKLLAQFCKDKEVLNAFCYSGGFSVYALKSDAARVDSVDSSKRAISLLEGNLKLNEPFNGIHEAHVSDVQEFFKNTEREFDVIVLDPPAYAKHKAARHRAMLGYKGLAKYALRKLKKNGILMAFSCSHFVDRQLFEGTMLSAMIEAGRQGKVLHHLSHPPDHPVSIFHPEGEYLKGVVMWVE